MPGHLSSVMEPRSRVVKLPPPPPLKANQPGFGGQLLPGTKTGRSNPPGFPTLKTLQVLPEVRSIGVNVFGQASKRESLTLRATLPQGLENVAAADVAKLFLGHKCFFGWPYLREALVCSVSDAKGRRVLARSGHHRVRTPPISRASISVFSGFLGSKLRDKSFLCRVEESDPSRFKPWNERESGEWRAKVSHMSRDLTTKSGVVVEPAECPVLLHVRPLTGLVRHVDGSQERLYAKDEVAVPLQVTLQRHPNPDPRQARQGGGEGGPAALEALASEFPEGSRALFLGRAHYGSMATVLGRDPRARGMLRVAVDPVDPHASSTANHVRSILTSVRTPMKPGKGVPAGCLLAQGSARRSLTWEIPTTSYRPRHCQATGSELADPGQLCRVGVDQDRQRKVRQRCPAWKGPLC